MTKASGKNHKSCCTPHRDTGTRQTLGASAPMPVGNEVQLNTVNNAMIELSGGWFNMGAADGPHPEDGEGPVREVYVDAFGLSATAVTNNEFLCFTEATGYRTLAERSGESFVFFAFVDAEARYQAPVQAPWWRLVAGACWHSPDGPDSNISDRLNHPVTHISFEDALAYCYWSGGRLPSEAEWEFAARGGLQNKAFPWGDALELNDEHHCNVWQGRFPDENLAADGYIGIAPVDAFNANGSGFYNMSGNVWEWVADRFTTLHSPRADRNPTGPLNGSRRVSKGGSYLCHASYCSRYRTSSRQGLPPDTYTGNLGFRIARNIG